ncbi:hypothetical protein KUCAC02_032024, partial [Chaenocephalus aceratus]
VIALAEAAQAAREQLEEALVRLRGSSHLLVLLLSLVGRRAVTPPCPTSCAAASPGAPGTRPPLWPSRGGPVLGLPRDTARLKKHITLLCERIAKGGRLTLASEANAPVPLQVQNLAAPGGVEPIAEVSADGEEPELQQDATKFIKKKQPSKKVKKGRITPHLLLLRLASTIHPSKNTAPRLRLNPEQIPDTDICSLSVTRCLIPLTAQSSVSWVSVHPALAAAHRLHHRQGSDCSRCQDMRSNDALGSADTARMVLLALLRTWVDVLVLRRVRQRSSLSQVERREERGGRRERGKERGKEREEEEREEGREGGERERENEREEGGGRRERGNERGKEREEGERERKGERKGERGRRRGGTEEGGKERGKEREEGGEEGRRREGGERKGERKGERGGRRGGREEGGEREERERGEERREERRDEGSGEVLW